MHPRLFPTNFPILRHLARWATAALLMPSAAAAVDFSSKIRPILENHCTECHGEDRTQSRLRLDNVVGLLRGGESGEPLLVPGNSEGSYLIRRVSSADEKQRMPPKGPRIAAHELEALTQWIAEGAQIPGAQAAREELKLKTKHWSFQKITHPEIPGSAASLPLGQIDAFIFAKLRENGLSPSPMADRATLIRRLHLVVHGMPPTPQEVARFVNDPRPEAYEQLVDSVLESPRFGERWARHWMDVVRHADSNGFETNRERKSAYHFRDWLIGAFNSDMPYDEFIRKQLAGDQLGADAATGFLVAGPYDVVKSPDLNLTLMQRQDELADMVSTTGTAFLGMTIGCARCHNHKFDPILQKDYYSMQAIFAGVNHGERPLREKMAAGAGDPLAEARAAEAALDAEMQRYRTLAKKRPPVNAQLNEEHFPPVQAIAVRFIIEASSGGEPCIDELEINDSAGKNIALLGSPSASGTLPGFPIHQLAHINDGKTGNDHSWISNTSGGGWVRIDFAASTLIERIVWSRSRNGGHSDRLPTIYRIEAATSEDQWTPIASSADRQPYDEKADPYAYLTDLKEPDAAAARGVLEKLKTVRQRIGELQVVPVGWAGVFSQPGPTHRLYRGEPLQKREAVAPDALSVIGTLGLGFDAPEAQRRMSLAEWLANPQNPLVARVMANRIWHYTFGSGIVATPDDFGANGSPPTHPELLDWLAHELVSGGWSIKQLQRKILLSATFRQASTPRADAVAADAGGRFLWRYTPRRMEAEAIRDSILAVSGALDSRMGGPGFYLMDVVEENVMHYFPKQIFTPAEYRRMVYQFRIRQTSDSVFTSFDCPDGSSVTPRRNRSNTPLQALNLFNSSFVIQLAGLLAERLEKETGGNARASIELAFQLAYGRAPDPQDLAASLTMIEDHGLVSFSRALYNTSEFLFIF
jgi:hypothetical protein